MLCIVGLTSLRARIDGAVLTSKVVLIYVLGGISFMEISALRFLSKREECELNHPRYLSSF